MGWGSGALAGRGHFDRRPAAGLILAVAVGRIKGNWVLEVAHTFVLEAAVDRKAAHGRHLANDFL